MIISARAGQDVELAHILAHTLQDVGACSLKAVLANMLSATAQIGRARASLDALAMQSVHVGEGSGGGRSPYESKMSARSG